MSRQSVKLQVECLEERSLPSSAASIGPLPQSVSDQMLAAVIPVLNSLSETLVAGYQDYNGHRVTAINDITLAENQITASLKFVGSGSLVVNDPIATTPRPKTQAASDALLGAGLPVLQSEITTLEGGDHDYGGHRVTAIQDLINAVTQLNEALAYSAAHDRSVK
jgi:hypothetical protein